MPGLGNRPHCRRLDKTEHAADTLAGTIESTTRRAMMSCTPFLLSPPSPSPPPGNCQCEAGQLNLQPAADTQQVRCAHERRKIRGPTDEGRSRRSPKNRRQRQFRLPRPSPPPPPSPPPVRFSACAFTSLISWTAIAKTIDECSSVGTAPPPPRRHRVDRGRVESACDAPQHADGRARRERTFRGGCAVRRSRLEAHSCPRHPGTPLAVIEDQRRIDAGGAAARQPT